MARKVRKAVIPAAGRGTRQYPASAAVAKVMFPLVDRDGVAKPLVQVIAEEAIDAGIEEICIVVGPGEEGMYRDYFRRMTPEEAKGFRGKDWAVLESERLAAFGERLHFAVQETPEGYGHAVYQAKRFVGDEPFLLMLGDHVYISETKERCARQVTRVFEEMGAEAVTGVQATLERDLHLFGTIRGGVVEGEEVGRAHPTGEVRGMVEGVYRAELIIEKPSVEEAREKLATPGMPAGNYLSHFGLHAFGPGIFESLEYLIRNDVREKGEIQLTAAQEHLRAGGAKYYVVQVKGQRYDTGVPYGLMETQLALGLNGVHRTEMCEAIARILAMQVRA